MCPLGVNNLFCEAWPCLPLKWSIKGMFFQCLLLFGYKGLVATIVGDNVCMLELTLVLAYSLVALCNVRLKSWRAVYAIIERASIICLSRPWISTCTNTALICSALELLYNGHILLSDLCLTNPSSRYNWVHMTTWSTLLHKKYSTSYDMSGVNIISG